MLSGEALALVREHQNAEMVKALLDITKCSVRKVAEALSLQQLSRIDAVGFFRNYQHDTINGLGVTMARKILKTYLKDYPMFRSSDPEMVVLKIEALAMNH
jgi:hypothetical protein